MSFEEFQDGRPGSHLGYRNGTILAILNLHIATLPPTKFQFNPTYGSGGEVVLELTLNQHGVPFQKGDENNMTELPLPKCISIYP